MGSSNRMSAGYSLFVHELSARLGNRAPAEHISRYANMKWAQIGVNDREAYVAKARGERRLNENRLSSAAYESTLSYHIENYDLFLLNYQIETKHLIRQLVERNELENHNFYIMHFNYIILKSWNGTRMFFPNEVALVRFSLRSGVLEENIYQSMLKPGAFSISYNYTVDRFIVNDLTVDVPTGNECDLEAQYCQIMNFLTFDAVGDKLPIIFIQNDDEYSGKFLTTIGSYFRFPRRNVIINSVSFLLHCLKQQITGEAGRLIISNLAAKQGVFDSSTDSSCDYHKLCEESSSTQVPRCSKSIVTRSAYAICKNCCENLNIRLIPGQHTPLIDD